MKRGTKVGGIAAIIQALCYVFGFVLLATAMNPGNTEDWTRLERLEFILERQDLFIVWNTIIYVVFGIALVVLTAVLHRTLERSASLMMSIASPFGFIWSGLVIASGMVATVGLSTVARIYERAPEDAVVAWSIIGTVQDGLGGGVEIVGGIWVLLVSIAAIRGGSLFPRPLNWLGLVVGTAGIITVVPALSAFGAVFGLAQILWFIGVGVVLLRADDAQQAATTDP